MSGNLSVIHGDQYFAGNVSFKSVSIVEASLRNSDIIPNAGIEHSKVIHKLAVRHSQKAGAAVVAETVPAHIAAAAGKVLAIEVMGLTPPTSSDTVTIDLYKGNVSTAFATVLSAPITLNSSSVTRTVYTATIADVDYADGDQFEIVITVSGTSAQGLVIVVWLAEAPQQGFGHAQLSNRQLALIAEATKRTNGTPRGRPRGKGTHEVSPTNGWLAKLTSPMSYDANEAPSTWKASFSRWGPEDPNDDDSEYIELEDKGLFCWPWTLKSRERYPTGTRVIVGWINGRWHVIEAWDCPQEF